MSNAISLNDDDDEDKWSNTLPDLLRLIAVEFDNPFDKDTNYMTLQRSLSDLLTFRSVCKSWRSVAMADARLTPYPPLFLVPYDKSDDVRKFYGSSSYGSITVAIPESVGKLIIGTAHGFLILLSRNNGGDDDELLVSLYNPITGSHIRLPTLHLHENQCRPMTSFHALLSSNPCSDPPPTVAVWAYNKLLFLTLGDDHWRSSSRTNPYKSFKGVLAYCQGSFFLSTQSDAKIRVIDAQSLESSELDVPLEEYMNCASYRMIVFSENLLLVVSNYDEPSPYRYKPYATFKLVKENIGQSQLQWRWLKEDYNNNKCDGPDGRAFFLSEYSSFAVASPYYLFVGMTDHIYNGFSYWYNHEYIDYGDAYTVCIAKFDLPFTEFTDECVTDEEMWADDTEYEYSDAEEEYWSRYEYDSSDEKDNVCSTKKVRRRKDGTVCTWFLPDPR